MQIKIAGVANLRPAQAQFAALEAQVASLNKTLEKSTLIPAGGSVQSFQATQRGMKAATAGFEAALAASGKYRVEQVKLNDVLDHQVQLMQKQKLTMKQMGGMRGIVGNVLQNPNVNDAARLQRDVYTEQLKMRQMAAGITTGGTKGLTASLAIPTEVHKSWDTFGNRVGFAAHQLQSASGALVNWGKNTQWAGRQLTAGLSMPIAAFGAALGVMAYNVDKEMTRIVKVYNFTADVNSTSSKEQARVTAETEKLKQDAYNTSLDVAKKYGATMKETLGVQAELAATGQKGAALQKNTAEIMRISMLGEIDTATTTKALIALQQTLGLNTKETADAFNYMNATENATSLTMADFATAIPRAAAPIKQMGGDLKDLGVLLVAMKSRGIDAAQGANAIKAMMQRLYRPSKQIKEEWQGIADVNLDQVISSAGGNIMKILPQISKALKGLDKAKQTKLLAGLFGTYQVTRMKAMLDGLDQMNDKTSQTYAAIQVAGNTAQKNEQIAAQEAKQQADSISGQFKRALATVQAELVPIGREFIKAGTIFLKFIGLLAKGFNAIPSGVKKVALISAGLAAMFGPLVMLTGLIANFTGTMGRLFATMVKNRTAFTLLTKEQLAEKIAGELARNEFEAQAKSGQVLTGQVMALNAALAELANTQAMLAGQPPIKSSLGKSASQWAAIAGMGPVSQRGTQIYGTTMGTKKGAAPFKGAVVGDPSMYDSRGGMSAKQMERAYTTNEKLNAEIAATQANIAKNTEKTTKSLNGGSVAMGAMAASMVAMSVSSNKVVDNVAQWTMMLSLAIPAAHALKDPTIAAGKAMAAGAKSSIGLAKKTYEASKGAGALSRAATATGAGLMAAGRGITAFLGPVGLAVTGIATIGFLAFKWYKHQKAITAEMLAENKAITDQNNLVNDTLNISQERLKTLNSPSQRKNGGEAPLPGVNDVADAIKGTKSGQALISAVQGGDSFDRASIATEKYIQVLKSVGGNSEKARLYVEALFTAAGLGADKAAAAATKAYNAIGDYTDPHKLAMNWANLIGESLDKSEKAASQKGAAVGKEIADSIANGANAGDTLSAFKDSLLTQWNAIFADLDSQVQKNFASFGITTGEQLKKATDIMKGGGDVGKNLMNAFNVSPDQIGSLTLNLGMAMQTVGKEANNLNASEKAVAQTMGKQLGLSEKQLKNVKTIADIQKTYNYKLLSANNLNAEQLYKDELKNKGFQYGTPGTNDPAKIAKINMDKLVLAQQALVAAGLPWTDNLSQAEIELKRSAYWATHTADATNDAADKADKLAKNIHGVPREIWVAVNFKGQGDAAKIQQSGMEGVTNDLADRASSIFDNKMNAALAANTASWDRKITAQQAAGERASNRLDNKWERINNQFEKRWSRRKDAVSAYYDKRIEGIDKSITAEQKAEDIRQRIFEAEQARIQRQSEQANSTIDFNLALRTGKIDEAAKIRNDMEAKAQDWMLSDASASSKNASQSRQDKLGTQKDLLSKDKDQALKALDDKEKAEKASLDRREKAEKAALDRRTKAGEAALQQQQKDSEAANAAMWASKKTAFENQLNLFKAFIGRNEKEVKDNIKRTGLSYDDFGLALKGKGEQWSKFFETSMVQHMREAGLKMASDQMWAGLGAKQALEVAKGMGFNTMAQLKAFVLTGKMPATFGKNLNKAPTSQSKNGVIHTPGGGAHTSDGHQIMHGGGWIGSEVSNRKGVARNVKGIHPSEEPILARKGEFLVNADSAKKYSNELEAMNHGKAHPHPNSPRNVGDGVGGGPISGLAGIVSNVTAHALTSGIGVAMQELVAKKKRQIDAASSAVPGGDYTSGKAGQYSDRAFSKAQLNNAAIIASVGSGMGMSKRDIEIGIMTAITESGLSIPDQAHSDRDSAGLFQQRPSQGWGTVQQVMDPRYASHKFFSVLKGVKNRNKMTPWAAAQAVQRSGTADGSNYQQYWDNAIAIYDTGLTKTPSGGYGVATGGTGGWHRASIPGKGWVNSHDYRNGLHSPIFAYNDGRIIESRAIRHGGSGENAGAYPKGYASYGVTVVVQGKDGNKVRAAHGWPGTNAQVGPVKGGAKIMESAATGNASGPHTHFEVNGQEIAREWFASHGIGLKKGGAIKKDGIANLHKNEVVLDAKRTKELQKAIDHFNYILNHHGHLTKRQRAEYKKDKYELAAAKHEAEKKKAEAAQVAKQGGDVRNKIGRTAIQGMGGPLGGLYPGQSTTSSDGIVTGGATTAEGDTVNTPASSSSSDTSATGKDSGRAFKLSTGSYNMFSHTGPSTKGVLAKLINRVGVLALQEYQGKKMNQGIEAFFHKNAWNMYHSPWDTALAWDTKKYVSNKTGSYSLNPKHFGKAGLRHRYAAYGLFTDKKTGRQFWQVSVHTAPKGDAGHTTGSPAQRAAIINEQGERMNLLYRQLKSTGRPVFISGDMAKAAQSHVKDAKSSRGKRNVFQTLSQYGAADSSSISGAPSDHAAWISKYNIPQMKTGGTVRFDNTLANLHKDERVLTAGLSRDFEKGLKNFASGGQSVYHINVDATGTNMDPDEMVYRIKTEMRREEGRKASARR